MKNKINLVAYGGAGQWVKWVVYPFSHPRFIPNWYCSYFFHFKEGELSYFQYGGIDTFVVFFFVAWQKWPLLLYKRASSKFFFCAQWKNSIWAWNNRDVLNVVVANSADLHVLAGNKNEDLSKLGTNINNIIILI